MKRIFPIQIIRPCRGWNLAVFWLVGVVAVLRAAGPSEAGDRPFGRVLVLPGSGMTPGLAIGIYDAVCDAGKKPDLIIATCGSALSAAAIGSYPDRWERNAFLASPDHHSMYLSATIRRPGACGVLCRFTKTRIRGTCKCLPDTSIFDVPVMEVPLRPKGSHHIHKPFPTEEGVPRIIMLASEVDYCPACEPRNKEGMKYYRETYFTDPDTARFLYNRPSDIAAIYPSSHVKNMTQVKLGTTMGDAARASISDPYYMNITHIDGRYFATGAVNLHPIELGQALGNEVIIPYFYPVVDSLGQSSWGTFFGYDIRKRAQLVNRQCATHWIDFSDFHREKKALTFDPVAVPNCGVVLEGDSCLMPMRVVTGVPSCLSEFQERVDLQWRYGYERTLEALRQRACSKAHIRISNCCDNMKAQLRSPQLRIR